MERVATYARVSSHGQEERHTIADQLAACREYIKQHDYELVAEFLDDGVRVPTARRAVMQMIWPSPASSPT